jgi:hypothetical protein
MTEYEIADLAMSNTAPSTTTALGGVMAVPLKPKLWKPRYSIRYDHPLARYRWAGNLLTTGLEGPVGIWG